MNNNKKVNQEVKIAEEIIDKVKHEFNNKENTLLDLMDVIVDAGNELEEKITTVYQ